MSTETDNLPTLSNQNNTTILGETSDLVTMIIAGQMFGIPVLQVQDVLNPQRITRIPLAPREVAGSLNLRGRIVTVIDLSVCLNLPKLEKDAQQRMSIVVDYQGELYSLLVDQIGEVLSLPNTDFEHNPPTLERRWREIALGIYRLNQNLLVVLDVARLLNIVNKEDAA
jgi:purine-binding chemotaxis protein CheW